MTAQHKLFTFHGGIHPAENKNLSNKASVRHAKIPNYIVIPLHQHIGKPAEAIVNVGDRVLKGQKIGRALEFISAPIHAPTSGKVIAIGKRPVPSNHGELGESIVIETDGLDEWIDLPEPKDFREMSQAELQETIRLAGIVGLGGATFPSHAKIPGARKSVDMLVINGAECEPYITCDDMLMRDSPNEILGGIEIMMHALNTEKCLIGIEDNKPEAADTLRRAIERKGMKNVEVVITPTLYPTGGEKQLITVLTGKQVPSGGLPIDIGIVVHNVGTAAATYEAIVNGHPIISRLVTVTGGGIAEPCNIEVLLGTPIKEIVEQCGGYTDDFEYLIAGGPMMGMALENDEVPLVKRINCILVGKKGELSGLQESLPCIRCGSCTNVCPINLLPQQMFWYAKADDLDQCLKHNVFDCIECGCCSYTCPSKIPLVQAFQYAKFEIRTMWADEKKAEISRKRTERKQIRVEAEKKAAAERKAKALAAAAAKKAAAAQKSAETKPAEPAKAESDPKAMPDTDKPANDNGDQ